MDSSKFGTRFLCNREISRVLHDCYNTSRHDTSRSNQEFDPALDGQGLGHQITVLRFSCESQAEARPEDGVGQQNTESVVGQFGRHLIRTSMIKSI